MKRISIAVVAGLVVASMGLAASPVPELAACRGKDPCKVCKDCTRCRYCTDGHKCGVCLKPKSAR